MNAFKKLQIEMGLIEKGYKYICGTDEVGMSPFAGGFTVCALILDLDKPFINLINDSKQLTRKQRLLLEPIIKERAINYSLVYVDAETINRNYNYVKGRPGSFRFLHLNAMKTAVMTLRNPIPDIVIVDHYTLPMAHIPQIAIEGGDKKSATIAGASILAKCDRERRMEELAKQNPGYEHWATTFGTWSIRELIALHTIGPTKYHRIDFIEHAMKCKSGALRKDKQGNYYLDSNVYPAHKKQYITIAKEYGLKLRS